MSEAKPDYQALYEMTRKERDALADAIEAVRHLEPAMTIPEHVAEWDAAEAFFEGSVHAAQAFRAAIIEAIQTALKPL